MKQLAKKEMSNPHKIAFVIDGLSKGITRDTLATELGYSNYKCMDIFPNRNGYKWNKQKQNYDAQQAKCETTRAIASASKAEQVVRFIEAGKELREVAVLTGFGEVQSMATFMLAKGYVWNDDVANYEKGANVQDTVVTTVSPDEGAKETVALVSNETPIGTGITLSLEEQFLLKQALPLIQQLLENKDTLEKFMNSSGVDEEATLPRFTVPGRYMTKCVHMTDLMDQLVKDYSVQNNVSQKDIFTVALVEFFRKYGFANEVNILLGV